MDSQAESMQNGDTKSFLSVSQVLTDLKQHLQKSLANLEALNASSITQLHDDKNLPDPEHLEQAALTVDLLHKIQLLLDPPALLIADQFLGLHSFILSLI